MKNTHSCNNIIRNILVSKNKNSDFLNFFQDPKNIQGASILRILPSGNYYIYTLKIEEEHAENVISEIKKIQEQWI